MPGTLCYQKVYFKTNPCRSQDILLFSFPPKLAACFPNPFFQWDKAVFCHLWRQMANWLNTLTKEFTQQTTNQWKYRYTAFFFFFLCISAYLKPPVLIRRRQWEKKMRPKGRSSFLAWFYERPGVGWPHLSLCPLRYSCPMRSAHSIWWACPEVVSSDKLLSQPSLHPERKGEANKVRM